MLNLTTLTKVLLMVCGLAVLMTLQSSPVSAQQQVQNTPVDKARNPYEAACYSHTTAEYKKACFDAANGTVVILRNPEEVIDPVRDGFLASVERAYGTEIPVEFRDTTGPTTIFMFDKNLVIPMKMLANGSLLAAIGKIYTEKVAALNTSQTQE